MSEFCGRDIAVATHRNRRFLLDRPIVHRIIHPVELKTHAIEWNTRMRVTLKDIAKKIGVDKSAVSLALNDRTAGKLSPARVKQIREMAEKIGYLPNLSAKNLAQGKTQCIGVVLSFLDEYPHNHYFNLIAQACEKAGYHAVPLPVGRRSLFESSQTMNLSRVHVDGMIVLDYMPSEDGADLQERLSGHPLVCRYADPLQPRPRCPSVMVDYYEGTCKLLKHIVSRGWRKFQFIVECDPARPQLRNGGRPLAAHYERAISDTSRQLNLPIPFEEGMIRTPERGAKARYDSMMAYLSSKRIQPGVCLIQDGADGISGTYAALTKMGYAVGSDVAVAALHAIPAWEHVEPVVTFTFERYEEISRLLVDLAVSTIEGRGRQLKKTKFDYSTLLLEVGAVPDVSGRLAPA
jgi:DNA-binding LacI/PurR family transcriptional regulator